MESYIFIELLAVTILGLVFGSFATALIHRSPQKKSWVIDRSACPNCDTILGARDLVPLFSWIFSKGCCRHCGTRISVLYPSIEMLCAVLCIIVYTVLGFSYHSLFVMAAVPILVALCIVDFKYLILPNSLVLTLFVIGVVRFIYIIFPNFSPHTDIINLAVSHLGGAFIYAFLSWALGFILTKILKKDSLGFGDVKFFGVAGLWLGIDFLPYFMMMSGVTAIIFAVIWKAVTKQEAFPFGPSLILSFYVLSLFSSAIFLVN